MDNSLTFLELWYIFWGLGYRVNHRSKEIHKLSNKQHNCKHEFMSKKTSEYVGREKALRLIKEKGYNGCRWCWPRADKG